ncbi:MAG: oxidoreductase [Gemmatimonadota bacterium]|nr:oxidoreductase [Gemmatimonadota bacterium]
MNRRGRVRSLGKAIALSGVLTAPAMGVGGQSPSETTELESGVDAVLQAVSPVGAGVVWVSGHEGVVLRSTDAGDTWVRRPVQTLDSLQFRDIHAFDAGRAVVLSAGPGSQSRIYRTDDGGATWSPTWVNDEPEGFYDCLDFWDERRGVAYGDAVGGELRILLTGDGGRTWRRLDGAALPPAVEGEGGFAASGTCVETGPDGRAWIGTGAGERARLLATADYGDTWAATDLPIVSGSGAGAFSVVFGDDRLGVVLGGDLGQPDGFTDNVAITDDGGVTWDLATRTPIPGAVYGGAMGSDGAGSPILLAAGPGGLAVTSDATGPWRLVDPGRFWAVGASGSTAWAVGPSGRILRLRW